MVCAMRIRSMVHFFILFICLAHFPAVRSIARNKGWSGTNIGALLTRDTRTVYCGAALLTERHAITAARCSFEQGPLLAYGSDIFNSPKLQVIPVKAIIPHEDYNQIGAKNDIALVLLEGAVVFEQGTGPACLPAGRMELTGQTVSIVGWNWDQNKETAVVRWLEMSVMPLSECAEYYGLQTNPPTQICTDILTESSPACQGDGTDGFWPLGLVRQHNGRSVLVGLVSYGLDCSSLTPGVSTLLSAYTQWILSAIRGSGIPGQICQIS